MKIIIYKMEEGCAGCKALEKRLQPFLESHPECAAYVEYRNVEDHDDEVQSLNIMQAPCMICIDKSGAPVWRINGYSPTSQYEKAIENQVRHAADCDKYPQAYRSVESLKHE